MLQHPFYQLKSFLHTILMYNPFNAYIYLFLKKKNYIMLILVNRLCNHLAYLKKKKNNLDKGVAQNLPFVQLTQ